MARGTKAVLLIAALLLAGCTDPGTSTVQYDRNAPNDALTIGDDWKMVEFDGQHAPRDLCRITNSASLDIRVEAVQVLEGGFTLFVYYSGSAMPEDLYEIAYREEVVGCVDKPSR